MKKSVKYEANALLSLLIVAAILIFILVFAEKYPYQIDLTKNRVNTLSEQTVKILEDLNEPVKALCFYQSAAPRHRVEALLKQYGGKSRNFTYEFIDPDKNVSMAEKYGVTAPDTIYLEKAAKRERVRGVSEESFTNALIALTRTDVKTVYCLTGHGEIPLEAGPDTASISLFAKALESESYQVLPLNLIESGSVPEDAACLIIAGPKQPVLEAELDAVDAYLDRGGSVLWLLGAKFPAQTAGYFTRYHIALEQGIVVDPTGGIFGDPAIIPVMTYGQHPILQGFSLITVMPLSKALEMPETPPADWDLTPLAFSSPESQRADLDNNGEALPGQSAYCLAVTAQRKTAEEKPGAGAEEPSGSKKKDARLAVFGSSLMIADNILSQQGNKDFLMNTVNWLSADENLISIRAKDESFTPLAMNGRQKILTGIFTIALFPVLLIGAWIAMVLWRSKA